MKINKTVKNILPILFIIIAYWPISCMQFTMKYDMMDWFFPMRFLVGECLQNATLPLWNPYTNLGYPLHTDPQSGALYPITWVLGYCFGYTVYTINIEYVLHLIIGYYAMKKLAETLGISSETAIILGLSYACCGFFLGNAQHLSWIISAAWLPFIMAFYLQLIRQNHWRPALALSLCCTMLLTGGYPAFAITVFYLIGIAFLSTIIIQIQRRQFKKLKKFIVLNSLFGVAFVLQSLVFIKEFLSARPFLLRSETLSLAEVQALPFSPIAYLSFILPFSTGGKADFFKTDPSMANAYFGIIAFVFLIVFLWERPSGKTILLWLMAIFFLLVALGDYFILRAFLYEYIPLMNLFRYPALFRVFSLICLLLLFGLSFEKLQKGQFTIRIRNQLIYLGFAFLFLITGLIFFAWSRGFNNFPQAFSATGLIDFINKSSTGEMVLIQGPIQIALLGIFLFVLIYKKGNNRIKYITFLILFDLFLSVQLNIFITASSEAPLSALQQKLNEVPDGFPIPEQPISTLSHHGNKEYYPIWYNLNILKKQIANNGYNNFKFKAYRDFKARADHMTFLNHHLLYPLESFSDSLNEKSGQKVEITDFQPTCIKANLDFREKGDLIMLQYFYPGWQVKIDGKELSASSYLDFFLKVPVPKGIHQIELFYHPKGIILYLLLSGFCFVFTLIVLLVDRYKNPKPLHYPDRIF